MLQLSPLQLILLTVLSVYLSTFILRFLKSLASFMTDFRRNCVLALFRLALWLPCGRHYLNKEQAKVRQNFEKRVRDGRKAIVYRLPEEPWREDTILNRIKQGSQESRKFYTNGGKMSASVFCAQDDHWDFISEVMRHAIESNPLWVREFSHIA
jgi:hypothetical protein